MKKIKDNPALKTKMEKALGDLQSIIEEMDEKRGEIFTDWLTTQNRYLAWEPTFDPLRLRNYKRGEIVFAHFGFNVGAEYGGLHYAVIMDKKQSKSNPLVNVVPLSSLKEGKTKDELHIDEVYLGGTPINDKQAFAIPNQFRPVSKLRVFKPRLVKERAWKLSNEQMDAIDEKIRLLFTKQL